MTKKGAKKETAEATEEKKLSNHAQRHLDEKKKGELKVSPTAAASIYGDDLRCED